MEKRGALDVEAGELVFDQDGVGEGVVGDLVQPDKVLGDGLHNEAREGKAEIGHHRYQDQPDGDLLQACNTCKSVIGTAHAGSTASVTISAVRHIYPCPMHKRSCHPQAPPVHVTKTGRSTADKSKATE